MENLPIDSVIGSKNMLGNVKNILWLSATCNVQNLVLSRNINIIITLLLL